MSFTPRTSAPARNNKYYYSDNIFYQSGYGMPNCTAYAWGRFYEISGVKPSLCTGNAGDWYPYNLRKGTYKHGTKPKVGAVMCWSKPGAAGHVAIVEKINPNGSVLISESGYNSFLFRNRTASGPMWNSGLGSRYIFQGFIYNPSTHGGGGDFDYVDGEQKRKDFIHEAESHKGEDGTWTWKTSGLQKGQPWCAAFIVAVAKKVGILNQVIANSFGAGTMIRLSSQLSMGKFYKGPWHGKSISPKPGDLISIRYHDKGSYRDVYDADHIGIVRSSSGSNIYTVEGNWSNKVSFCTRNISSKQINGIYRPNWNKISSGSGFVPLYDELNDRNDAMIREIGYMTPTGEPSIYSTGIKLSVVNYTSFLSGIWEMLHPGGSSSNANLDKLPGNARIIAQFMMDKGCGPAGAVSIIANIFYESGFRPDAVEYGYTVSNGGIGICQWTNYPRTARYGRNTNMRKFVGPNWRHDLTGQCEFLYHELTTGYTSVWNHLKSLPNTEAGAREGADYFVRHFEKPGGVDRESIRRQNKASEYWGMIAQTIS